MDQQGRKHHCAPLWHMDCLGTVAVLGLGFNKRQQERLAGRYGLTHGKGDPDPVEIFLELHEACHSNESLVRDINKELGGRFGETARRVRSSSPEELSQHEVDFPLPFIWAALSDPREVVRLEGRRRLHGLFLQALCSHRRGEESEKKAHETISGLADENRALHARITALEEEAKSLRAAAEEAAKGCAPLDTARSERTPPFSAQNICRRQQREMRKLSHALARERERSAALEEELRRLAKGRAERCNVDDPCPQGGDAAETTNPCPCPRAGEGQCIPRGTLVCRGRMESTDLEDRSPLCPLENMKIAIVGGTEKTLPEYRCMVRDLGGECLYHDGCTGSGVDRLRRIICSADVVVCITTLNSHGAVKMAKSFCKRKGKRFLVTRETGASSLREMLQRMAV